MVEPIPNADDATAYVLGTLGARDRRRFEAHLKKSLELQKVVRLLEAGSIGLAMAAPRREPPIRLWAGIQTAVSHECEKRGRSARRKWLRNVAAIAACAIVGWFAYTSWNHRASSASPTIVGVSDVVVTPGKVTDSAPPVLAQATSQATNLVSQPPRERRALRPGENATLRERVGDLENQVAHLAQTVTQQQTIPPALNRLTFVDIVPEGSDHAVSPQITTASPELRRALLLGVARQLGWMPPSPTPPQASTLAPPSPAPSTQPPEPLPPAPQTEAGVDFVDLPPPPVESPSTETTVASAQTPSSPPTTTATAATTTASEESPSRNASSIPAFVSGTNMVFAYHPPVGTETVSFYSGTVGGPVSFRGTIPVGNNPTVVTMPFFQLRAWEPPATSGNYSVGLYTGPGRILFNSASEGSATFIRITLPESLSSNP
jgi:hypothetical protein